MKKTKPIEELYRLIAEPLARYPDHLVITSQSTLGGCNVIASCHPSDQGRFIGVGGKMHKACEYLIRVAGRRMDMNARLIIESDFKSTHELRPFIPKENWKKSDNEYLKALLLDILGFVENGPFEIQTSDVSKHGTVVLVRTSEALTEQMQVSLETVMNAIGKARGRFVYLDVAKIYESAGQNIGSR